jgi:hypothetical protein
MLNVFIDATPSALWMDADFEFTPFPANGEASPSSTSWSFSHRVLWTKVPFRIDAGRR